MKYIKDFLFSSVSGLFSLLMLNLFGTYIGVSPLLSYINITVSSLLGIPGVIAVLVFENFLL